MKTSLACDPLDRLLEGGLEPGAITLVYGVPATGKTNLCLQAARSVVDQGLRVAYVDTEGVSFDRLRQVAGDHYDKMMANVLFSSPGTLRDQERLVKQAAQIPDAGLIIVDSLNFYYRLDMDDDPQAASRSMLAQLGALQAAARTSRIPVIVTAQVYERADEVLPFGGRTMGHIVKTIIELQRGPGGPLAASGRAAMGTKGFATADTFDDGPAFGPTDDQPSRPAAAPGAVPPPPPPPRPGSGSMDSVDDDGTGLRLAVLRKHRAIPEGRTARFRIFDGGLTSP